jgi:hypothetical protein
VTKSGTGRLLELLQTLLQATEEGKADWQPTDRVEAYVIVGTRSSVVIQTADQDSVAPYEMVLLDDKGTVAESVRSHRGTGMSSLGEKNPWADDLRSLWNGARVRALHIDEMVDTMIDDISKQLGRRASAEEEQEDDTVP